jgi:hypothetical protein
MIKENAQRLIYDLLFAVFISALFFTRAYESFPQAMQLTIFKMLLTSMAIIHAHIVGKLLFGTVDWKTQLIQISASHFIRALLYVALPICYAISG